MNRLQEIEARLAEIRNLLTSEDADLDALEAEVTALETERTALHAAAERRSALVTRVASGEVGAVVRTFPTPQPGEHREEERVLDASSAEYRSAFLKNAVHQMVGEWRFGEMTDVERRAFTNTTAAVGEVLPSTMSTRIWDLISVRYAIIKDLSWSTFGNIYTFIQNTSLDAGDPNLTDENVAGDDLELGFIPVTLTGEELKGQVKISRKMQIQSLQGFEDYLVRKFADRIGIRMNVVVRTKIVADVLNAHKATPAVLDESDFRAGFGKLRGASRVVVYANSNTIWNDIAGLQDKVGRPYFIESTQNDDPSVQGRIYGKVVKLDDTLADGVILYGDPDVVEANMFQDVQMASVVDVLNGTFETVHAAYALFDCALGDTRAWGLITVTPIVS